MPRTIRAIVTATTYQAILSIIIWGTICYLYATLKPVPEALLAVGGAIIGFWFRGIAEKTTTLKGCNDVNHKKAK